MYELVVLGDDKNDALRSLLHISLTHVAEFQVKMLKVISEKFSIELDTLIEVVRDSPEFQTKALAANVVCAEVTKPVKTKNGRKVIIKPTA